MTLNLSIPGQEELRPRITVFGVGGAGGNAVNNMIEQALEGVEFVVANTDAQALQQSQSNARIQMGIKVTEGLGAGARATVGAAAAEESIEQIVDHLSGSHMCFITAGMGGGTGTGAAPIIAQAAREMGVLTVGVVTKPFQFEGAKRMRQANEGIEALQKVVDTLIIIPNQNLFRLANENTTFTQAFAMADDVLYQGVKGVTDLMVRPGLINLDFADVRSVMDEMGKAMMGTGEAEGESRAVEAAEKAIANPLLDEISLEGARGVLINITGGYDLTLFELDEAANKIREKVDADANIIVGSTLDTEMEGRMRVSVVATGIDAVAKNDDIPAPRRSMTSSPMSSATKRASAPSAGYKSPVSMSNQRATSEPQAQQSAPVASAPQSYRETPPQKQQMQFESFEPEQSYAPEESTQSYADDHGDLPPPAYQPASEVNHEPSYSAQRAPQASASSTPTPEAMARLQAAISQKPATRPQATAAEQDKARFGINSLINRMTGSGAQGGAKPQAQSFEEDEGAGSDGDRIEIPAFLRRQAN